MENKIDIIKGINFIEQYTERLMVLNKLEYQKGMVMGKLSYDENVRSHTHRVYKTSIVHDGTLMFLDEALFKMFWNFATSAVIPTEYRNHTFEENLGIKYIVGDIIIGNEYNVETTKTFPMMRQTISIPYDFVFVTKGEDTYE